ncbi:hypothetical protein GWK08_06695 [Leptobacterium flavescens]|uniref:Uncharacterized protein n=1 Tax=Leptobacterium flavescens TaxID=472055 RepID=A0A6P0UL24_9FLAO|nr:hypothetical protein [Leptobacterium flavescens]NER13120.1 hypothetical protein [Leptobacterium flavescens]
MKSLFSLVCFFCFSSLLFSQQTDDHLYVKGESLSDKHKFSNIQLIEEDGEGGVVIVRSYYGGMIMKLKGYYIEHYDADLQLINEYNYPVNELEIMGVFVADNRITVLEVVYDELRQAYVYWANSTSLTELDFKRSKLLEFKRKKEKKINFLTDYSGEFNDKFYSQLLFDSSKEVFAIAIDSKEKGRDKHHLYFFDKNLNKRSNYELKKETEARHLVFEYMEYDANEKVFYLLGKAYEKGKRTKAISKKFAYQVFRFYNGNMNVEEFKTDDSYASSLKLIVEDDLLKCVGFYSLTKSRKYRGLVYTEIDKNTLEIRKQKLNPFSDQFMVDKYGAEVDKEVKNLKFRGLHKTSDGSIVFNAEECYMNTNFKNSVDGSRARISRYHYNDIVCAKLDADGNMLWARNINKAESTQGDEAYVSYTSAQKGDESCFFINSGAIPTKISKNRILFKKGFSRSPEVYMIRIDGQGEMNYHKVTDNKDIRLPIMVSRGAVLKNAEAAYFLARRGNRKQLVKVML